MHMKVLFIMPVDVLVLWLPGHPGTVCWSPNWIFGYYFVKVSIYTCTHINIIVPVFCIWMWSSLGLWMSWLHEGRVIHRHWADHLTEYCFVPAYTQINIVVLVSYRWILSLVCLWMSRPRRCQAIHRFRADHPDQYFSPKPLECHDVVIKWDHSPHCWPFSQGIHQSPVIYSRRGQWRGAFMFSLICTWTNGWVNNWDANDLRCHRTHHDVIVMCACGSFSCKWI